MYAARIHSHYESINDKLWLKYISHIMMTEMLLWVKFKLLLHVAVEQLQMAASCCKFTGNKKNLQQQKSIS